MTKYCLLWFNTYNESVAGVLTLCTHHVGLGWLGGSQGCVLSTNDCRLCSHPAYFQYPLLSAGPAKNTAAPMRTNVGQLAQNPIGESLKRPNRG